MSKVQPNSELLTYNEYREEEEESKARQTRREVIKQAIDAGHEARARSDYDRLESIISGPLLSNLQLCQWNATEYDQLISGSPYEWHWHELQSYLHTPEKYADAAGIEPSDEYLTRANRQNSPEEYRRQVLECTFESLETAAMVEGYLPTELEDTQPAFEYAHQIGERYVRPESNASGDLELIDPTDDWKATLLAGGQGSGKSTAGGTLLEDRYAIGNKIVDLVDLNKAENVTYDIAEQSDLADVREEMGLDVGFDEFDKPEMEILVPLTRELENARIPHDVESGENPEPTVDVFTIPASELTYRQLVMLLPHTTDTQENHIRSAHERLTREGRDWTLADLAQAVRDDPKAGDKISDRIESSLRTVQNKSFIRDQECEHTLEWSDIMQNAEAITAFTLFQIRERIDKLLIISYLIDSLYDARHKLLQQGLLTEFPDLTCVMREMHDVAPRNKAEQSSESTIEGVMVDNLSSLFALMRHVNMEIVADTQKFHRQLHPNISSLFHRVYAFGGQKPDIQKIFNTRVSPKGNPAEKVSGYENGKCALVGGSVDGYKMPIQFAPPRHHHLDAKTDGDGFSFRARTLEGEELRPAPWDASIPERLQFDETPDDPVVQFIEKFITYTGDKNDYVVKEEITDAYNDWAEVNDFKIETHDSIHEKLVRHLDLEKSERRYRPTINGKKTMAHRCIRMRF